MSLKGRADKATVAYPLFSVRLTPATTAVVSTQPAAIKM
jgi:hypothetical protein